jgi:carboxymethylenebutenolidase
MPVKSEWITYGDQVGYFAMPERAARPLPGVVVIQEIGGVNDNIEDITRRIAAAGYAALAPDIFAVDGERPDALRKERFEESFAFMMTLPPAARFDPTQRAAALAKLPEPQRIRIEETFTQAFSKVNQLPTFIPALRKAVGYLKTECPETKGKKVGCVGFCMGGGLSALLACEEPELDGAAIFYGVSPAAEQVVNINCPVVGFYAGTDKRINDGIPAFEAAMRQAGKNFEYRIYEGANHGFFNDTNPIYDVNAARDAFARLLTFFAKHLTN